MIIDITTLGGLASWISLNCKTCLYNKSNLCTWPTTVWRAEVQGATGLLGSGQAWKAGYWKYPHIRGTAFTPDASPQLPKTCCFKHDVRGKAPTEQLPALPPLFPN